MAGYKREPIIIHTNPVRMLIAKISPELKKKLDEHFLTMRAERILEEMEPPLPDIEEIKDMLRNPEEVRRKFKEAATRCLPSKK